MLIALGIIFPYKVYANTTNPFAAQDKNYSEQLLSTKSTYTEAELSSQPKKSEVLSVNGENRYLVKFGNDVSLEQINNLLMGYSYKIIGKSSNRLFRIDINDIEGFKVISKSIVQSIELDSKTQLSALPKDPGLSSQWAINALSLPNSWGITKGSSKTKLNVFPNDPNLPSQWAINALSLPNAWDITTGSTSTFVAVIDSGVSRNHEDLLNNQVRKGWDMLSNDFVYDDTVGHGTEVTGVIAATPNNYVGVSGTCWNVAIVPIAVVYYDGTIYTSDVVDAIYLAADLGCKVISLSLGSSSYSSSEDAAVQYATSKGCIVVASAGNNSNSTIKYPASFSNVISVGSINKYLSHSYFSNYNSYVDVSAPGEDILTTYDDYYGTSYASVDGTSFSAPYVAGIAALAATIEPGITATQFKEAIMASSTDLGAYGYDDYYGYGLINAEKLLKYVSPIVFVPVTYVSLNKTNSTMNVGDNDTLSATIAPTDATNQAVTWKSSNTAVATVDLSGRVVGVSAGTAVITVTTVDGSQTATCAVTVSTPIISVTGVRLNKSSSVISVGANDTLSAAITPTDATNQAVTWKSSNTAVATVDLNGKVVGVSTGTTVITATTVDGRKTATCAVTVSTRIISVTGVSLNKGSSVIKVGANDTLSAAITPTNATNKAVTWKSSNTAVATADLNGKVIGVSAGIAVITVTTVDGKKTATCTVTVTPQTVKAVSVSYQGHVQNIGWQNWVSDGQDAGTAGPGLRVEALKIKLLNAPAGASIKYQAHVQNVGWQKWVSDGQEAGTNGKSLRVEALKITLENMPGYSIQYQAHVQNEGWQDWVSDGQQAGTEGKGLRVEAIRIKIVKISDNSTIGVEYQGHVQSIGWQNLVSNGQISGTEGKGLRVEALKINLKNAPAGASIKYQAHVQNVGWQKWVSNGQEAGTNGKSLRVEALKITLENMPGYSVQYQVHVQNVGWQNWVSDGQQAGTNGKALRIEGLRIRIVKN